eukprot:11779284-Ditylum_brightwellii.AAC.1
MSVVRTGVDCLHGGCQEVVFDVAWQGVWTGVPVERYPAAWVIGGSELVLRNSGGSLCWNLAAAVRLAGQGKVGRCGGASVGDLAVFGARAEPFSCPDWSTVAYNNFIRE